MAEAQLERRRSPRVPMREDETVGLPVGLTVRLLDISSSGVLLFSPQALGFGQRATLRTILGADPFNADIEVRRVSAGGTSTSPGAGYRIGAAFVGLDDKAHRAVTRFLAGDVQQ
jgi:hypothetical protein